jgi:uncharacterized protein YvpB
MDIKAVITSFEYTVALLLIGIISMPIITVGLFTFFQKKQWIRGVIIVATICSIFIGFAAEYFLYERLIVLLTRIPSVAHSVPSKSGIMPLDSQHISVTFDAPVYVPLLSIHSNPPTKFTVRPNTYISSKFPYTKTVTLIPEVSFPPNGQVMVYIANINGLLRQQFGGEELLEFATLPLPTVTSISPPSESIDIPIKPTILIHLSNPSNQSSIWEIHSKPAVVLRLTSVDKTTLSVTADESLQQGTTYQLSLIQTPVRYNTSTNEAVEKLESHIASSMQFTTVKPALITSFTPNGYAVAPQADMMFTFAEPMDIGSTSATISPFIPVTPSFTNDGRTLRLAHQPFAKATSYTVTLGKDAKTLRGGTLLSDAIYTFDTAGPVTVIDASPAASFIDVPVTSSFSYTFDQDVNRLLVEKLFTVTPKIAGVFSWNNRTMTFIPKQPLSFATLYTATFQKGLGSVYGLDSTVDQVFSFTTAPEEYHLDVPFYKQQELFTCNIAAAHMLLSYRGVSITESKLKETIGSAGTRGSGNPYKGYVVNYGTYWDAVAAGVSKYRPVRIIKNWTLQQLLSEIIKKTPVMIWGQNGWSDPHEISWKTNDGTDIYAVNGMHSYIIRGFRGSIQSPTHILVVDPWRGIYTMTTEEFMRHASFFKVAMAVD